MVYKTGQMAAKIVLGNPRNTESFSLSKQSEGGRDDTGVYVPGVVTTLNLQGSIQPLTGKSREELPEGERLFDAICILYPTLDHDAISPLRVGSVQTESDIIIYNNLNWAVRVVHDMATFGHIEIYATRLENQNG
jgi:hypothetical protein